MSLNHKFFCNFSSNRFPRSQVKHLWEFLWCHWIFTTELIYIQNYYWKPGSQTPTHLLQFHLLTFNSPRSCSLRSSPSQSCPFSKTNVAGWRERRVMPTGPQTQGEAAMPGLRCAAGAPVSRGWNADNTLLMFLGTFTQQASTSCLTQMNQEGTEYAPFLHFN